MYSSSVVLESSRVGESGGHDVQLDRETTACAHAEQLVLSMDGRIFRAWLRD